jgi:hypothetical protein
VFAARVRPSTVETAASNGTKKIDSFYRTIVRAVPGRLPFLFNHPRLFFKSTERMFFILLLCLICLATSSIVERKKKLFNIVDYQNRYPLYCQNHLENCRGNGNCLLDRCICRPGWIGEKCDIPSVDVVDSCNYLTCSNRTVCSAGESKCDLQINCNENPNDSCHYHPDYGVIFVPFSRWAIAQLAEVKLWVTVEQSDDRNDEH